MTVEWKTKQNKVTDNKKQALTQGAKEQMWQTTKWTKSRRDEQYSEWVQVRLISRRTGVND